MNSDSETSQLFAVLALMSAILPLLLAIVVIVFAALWKLFTKAGVEGWEALVPLHNNIVQLKLGGKPGWWVFLMIIPYVGLVWYVWSVNRFVKAYGKNELWTIGCIFLPFIFYPIMAWSKNIQYIGDGNVVHQNHDPDVLDSFGK